MTLFNTLVQILISFLVIVTPIGIIAAVVLAVKASGEEDAQKKKRVNKWAIWSILGPIILLFLTLSAWGLIRILTNTVQG